MVCTVFARAATTLFLSSDAELDSAVTLLLTAVSPLLILSAKEDDRAVTSVDIDPLVAVSADAAELDSAVISVSKAEAIDAEYAIVVVRLDAKDPDILPHVSIVASEPVILPIIAKLPVKPCLSSAEFPNLVEPESNTTEALLNSVLTSCAVSTPVTTKLPSTVASPTFVKEPVLLGFLV